MSPHDSSFLPRAIVFDVDGTLYSAAPVRRAMARRLVLGHALVPWRAWSVLRGLSAYRKAQERLRGRPACDLAQAQLEAAEEASGVPAERIGRAVGHWMDEAPLDLVARHRVAGLAALLASAREAGVRLGVLSDYPPERKLEALGVAGQFDAVAWAQQPEVGVFKPDPAGLLHVLERLGCAPREALYVGDRPDVDGEVARAAGVRFALLEGDADAREVLAPFLGAGR